MPVLVDVFAARLADHLDDGVAVLGRRDDPANDVLAATGAGLHVHHRLRSRPRLVRRRRGLARRSSTRPRRWWPGRAATHGPGHAGNVDTGRRSQAGPAVRLILRGRTPAPHSEAFRSRSGIDTRADGRIYEEPRPSALLAASG